MSSDDACEASSFWGTESWELYSCSRRLGYTESVAMSTCCALRTYRNGQVVASGQLSDLANVPEGRTHDDCLVAVLLVVVEDGLDALDTGVLGTRVLLLGSRLEPVKNAAHEGGDEESASLSGSNSLDLREHEGEVAVDSVLGLQNLGGLDALPC